MTIYLASNIASLNAITHFNNTSNNLSRSMERLASGFKVNRAADGAANLTVSENMRSQIRGMQVAQSNVQQGISMLNTADAGAQQIYEKLQRLNEIAVAAQNGTTSEDQYTAYSAEVTQLLSDIDSIANNSNYNELELLSGDLEGAAFNIQIGANGGETLDINTAFGELTSGADGLGITQGTIINAAQAGTLQDQVKTAMTTLNTALSTIGGFQSQLESQAHYLASAVENMTAAEASVRNTDVAAETANLTRLQIQQQASAMVLAQANQMPSIALSLLR